MKVYLYFGVISICAMLPFANAKNTDVCKLNNGSVINVIHEHLGIDLVKFKLAIGDHIIDAFPGMIKEGFPEPIDVVLSRCRDGVFIYVINYGPPYQVGFLIRSGSSSEDVQRIDFSEKEIPEFIYYNKKEILVVIPNSGYEVSQKYIIYKNKNGVLNSTGSDFLPEQSKYSVINLRRK